MPFRNTDLTTAPRAVLPLTVLHQRRATTIGEVEVGGVAGETAAAPAERGKRGRAVVLSPPCPSQEGTEPGPTMGTLVGNNGGGGAVALQGPGEGLSLPPVSMEQAGVRAGGLGLAQLGAVGVS